MREREREKAGRERERERERERGTWAASESLNNSGRRGEKYQLGTISGFH